MKGVGRYGIKLMALSTVERAEETNTIVRILADNEDYTGLVWRHIPMVPVLQS